MKILWEMSPEFEQMGVGVGESKYKCYRRVPKHTSLPLSVCLSLSVSLIKLGKFIRGKQMFPSRNSDELKHLFKLNRSSTKLMSKRAWAPTVTHSQELTLASENPCPLSWEARHIPSFASPVSFYFLAWMVKIYLTLFFTSWYFIVYI